MVIGESQSLLFKAISIHKSPIKIAGMVELVDTQDLKSCVPKDVRVQVPLLVQRTERESVWRARYSLPLCFLLLFFLTLVLSTITVVLQGKSYETGRGHFGFITHYANRIKERVVVISTNQGGRIS
jgi:hypothetical protein